MHAYKVTRPHACSNTLQLSEPHRRSQWRPAAFCILQRRCNCSLQPARPQHAFKSLSNLLFEKRTNYCFALATRCLEWFAGLSLSPPNSLCPAAVQDDVLLPQAHACRGSNQAAAGVAHCRRSRSQHGQQCAPGSCSSKRSAPGSKRHLCRCQGGCKQLFCGAGCALSAARPSSCPEGLCKGDPLQPRPQEGSAGARCHRCSAGQAAFCAGAERLPPAYLECDACLQSCPGGPQTQVAA